MRFCIRLIFNGKYNSPIIHPVEEKNMKTNKSKINGLAISIKWIDLLESDGYLCYGHEKMTLISSCSITLQPAVIKQEIDGFFLLCWTCKSLKHLQKQGTYGVENKNFNPIN